MPKVTDQNFRYSNAAETCKEGYLSRKWHRLYPGWNKPKPAAPTPEALILNIVKRKGAVRS